MRSEYKEWAAQYNESQPISFYNGAIAAWQHQQSKVDELQAQLALCRNENKALLSKVNGLEKRVDSSLKKIDQFYCEGNLDSLEKAEQALKGGEA